MLQRIQETALKECQLAAGASVLVGVSGGPDSLCLLDGLHKLGFRPIAACFNHRLRPEAENESWQVEKWAARMGIPFIGGQGNVVEEAQRRGQSIEAAAREMRYRFLFSSARDFQADAVAVGHNANDQVETVLMHILRGSGLDGLRGIPFRSLTEWDDRIPLVRPLLQCWREEILAYCAEAGLEPIQDLSNLEPVYFRNRIRLELLPEIEHLAPGASRRIWNLARLVKDDLEGLDLLEQQAWSACVLSCQADCVRFDLEAVRALPEPMQRRLFRRAFHGLRPDGEGMDLENSQRAVNFVRSPRSDRKIELAQKLVLRVQRKELVLTDRTFQPDLTQFPQMKTTCPVLLTLPGDAALGNEWEIRAEICEPPDPAAISAPRGLLQLEAWLDANALIETLEIRPPRAGDRFQPLGMRQGSQKLSDFWIDRHIPADARRAWPLVWCGGQIIWVPGFSPAESVRIRTETNRCFHLRIYRVGKNDR